MSVADDIFLGTKKYNKKFTELCSPVMRYFGINAIAYIHINSKGELINLHTHLPWMERCMEQEYYNCDPSMVNPDNIASGFVVGDSYEGDYTNIMLKDCAELFDMHHSCSYVEKNKNSYELFCFDAPGANIKFKGRMLFEYKLLRRFISIIQGNLLETERELESIKVDFATIKGSLFNSQEGLVRIDAEDQKNRVQVLEEMGIASKDIVNVQLTTQEKRCLRLYIDGNTIKKVARVLKLSDKTVGAYIEQIKEKLGCTYRDELIRQADVLTSLGLL